MKIIVTFGPVIGGVILAAYVVVLRIYAYVKEKDTVAEKYKRIYKLMIIAEAVLCGITFFVPRVTGESYLPYNDTGRSDRQHKECLSDCLQGVQQGI